MDEDLHIGDVFIPKKDHPFFPLFCPKPTVRILFYTDDFSVILNNTSDFGVGILRDLIMSKNTFYVTFDIDLVNRHDGGHAARKITPALLGSYDQVWFFGVLQCNLPGQQENELTNPEVASLEAWMASGGVLITGDHANRRPGGADPGLDPFVNLGRAIGHGVPRAGDLRQWEGGPTAISTSSHNTQVPDGVHNLDDLTLQDDAIPQGLILRQYPLWRYPWWKRSWRPHPLFCGRAGPIAVFPDHMHEGQLTIPSTFPTPRWPSGPWGQPRPEVVARGTDKRNGSLYGVLTAYDGSSAGVGRVVADATWHHYFNVNLWGFPPGPVLDEIADYYVNLAVWLSPPFKRRAMRCWNWWWLAHNPTVRMVYGNSIAILGATAYDVLGRVASQCALSEFIWPFPFPEQVLERPLPPEELVIGSILQRYYEAFESIEAGGDVPDSNELVADGIRAAHKSHLAELGSILEEARGVEEALEQGLRLVESGDEAAR